MSQDPRTIADLGPKVRALEVRQRVFGRYDLIRKLGEGGFGAVWLAHDIELREDLALKFVLQAVAHSPEAVDSLKREAVRARRLTHPNIVRIHDFISGQSGSADSDLAAVSMEYVDGQSLAQLRLQQHGRCFDFEQIVPWIEPICAALSYAHHPKRRTIHRDLKPANILLSNESEIKIADFGIAVSLVNSVSQISGRRRSGTPAYMSPQQLGGEWPSETDDIYSLGATIYCLLTGTSPFHQGDIYHQVLHKIPLLMAEKRARLEIEGKAEIPDHVERMIAACLAKEIEMRPGSIQALGEGLQNRALPTQSAFIAHGDTLPNIIRVERHEPPGEQVGDSTRHESPHLGEPSEADEEGATVPAPEVISPATVGPNRSGKVKWRLAVVAVGILIPGTFFLLAIWPKPESEPTPRLVKQFDGAALSEARPPIPSQVAGTDSASGSYLETRPSAPSNATPTVQHPRPSLEPVQAEAARTDVGGGEGKPSSGVLPYTSAPLRRETPRNGGYPLKPTPRRAESGRTSPTPPEIPHPSLDTNRGYPSLSRPPKSNWFRDSLALLVGYQLIAGLVVFIALTFRRLWRGTKVRL